MRAATTPETVHETLRALYIGVQDAENAADRSLRAMIDALSKGSYLPSTREDLISIATSCDKVANKCKTISKIVVFQRFRCPSQYASDFNDIFAITKTRIARLIFIYFSAITSISTSAPLGSAFAATQDRAGLPVKYCA